MSVQTGKKIILSDQQAKAAQTIFGKTLGQQIIADAAKKELADYIEAIKTLEASVKELHNIGLRIYAFEQRNGHSTRKNGQRSSLATNYLGSDNR